MRQVTDDEYADMVAGLMEHQPAPVTVPAATQPAKRKSQYPFGWMPFGPFLFLFIVPALGWPLYYWHGVAGGIDEACWLVFAAAFWHARRR